MKKTLLWVASLIAGCVFIFFSLLVCDIVMFQSIVDEWFSFVAFVCILLVLFAGISWMNQKFDRAEGYASQKTWITRWGQNALFFSLVLDFIYASAAYLQEETNVLVRQNQSMILFCLMVVVMFGVIYYVQNYKNLLTRKTRIHTLIHKNEKYRNRRYTFVVEEINEEKSNLILKGKLSGNMHVFDEVYVYSLENDAFTVRILSIRMNEKTCRKAKDGNVEIIVKKNEKIKLIKKYCVLSDIIAVSDSMHDNQNELPYIRGLLSVYDVCHDDPHFTSLVLWLISHANLLVCAKSTTEHRGDIMDPLQENTSAAFMSVSTSADENLFILPAFTDWDALHRWSSMMMEKDAVTLIMKYEEVEKIMENGFGGIVINPFGPQPFFMPEQLCKTILQMNQSEDDK